MVGSNKVVKIFNQVIKIFNQKHWPVIVTFKPLRFFQVQIDISFSAFELDISQQPQNFISNELDISI